MLSVQLALITDENHTNGALTVIVEASVRQLVCLAKGMHYDGHQQIADSTRRPHSLK